MAEDEINTFNSQFIGLKGDEIVIALPKNQMTKQEALVHAAYLVVLADDDNRFPEILKAVQNT